MFSFKNIFTSFSRFRISNSSKSLTEFYQHFDIALGLWTSIAINKNQLAHSFITKELDLLTTSNIYSLKMADSDNGIRHQLYKNQSSIAKLEIDRNSPFLENFNQLISKHIQDEINHFQSILNIPENIKIAFTSNEIASEEKALEWIRVTFQVLEKAVIESLTNSDFLFQTLLFFGSNPKNGNHEIRLIIFNLDFKFELLATNILRVKIYDDKKAEFGSNKKAALEGDFILRKREMFDELIKLLSLVSSGIKW